MMTREEAKKKAGSLTENEIARLDAVADSIRGLKESPKITEDGLLTLKNILRDINNLRDVYEDRIISLLKQNVII